MRNDTCVICGKKFEPRESKLYCSDKCKSYAFNQRKKSEIVREQNKQEFKHQETLHTFYLSEWEELKGNFENVFSFMEYLFLRKNLKGPGNINQISAYLKVWANDEFFDDLKRPESEIYKQFQLFKKQLLNGMTEFYMTEISNTE